MEEKREKEIFIPHKIWTIKNLNLDEKLVLSDIYNKSKLKNFKGYNKKIKTLSLELGIKEIMITDIFKRLIKKKYIIKKTMLKTFSDGKIKTTSSYKYINYTVLENAERFFIDDNNIFYRKAKEGILITYKNIREINKWYLNGNHKQIQTIFFILFILIKKNSFRIDDYDEIFFRFKINDLAQYLGMTRQTASNHIKILSEFQIFKREIKSCLLFKIENVDKYTNISNSEKIHTYIYNLIDISENILGEGIIETNFMYILNVDLLFLLNLYFID